MKRQHSMLKAKVPLFKRPRINGPVSVARRIGESKFVDISSAQTLRFGQADFNAGVLLNGLANGNTASTRVGRKIHMTSLLIRGHVYLSSTSTGGGPVRILVVYDKQANAAAPSITDVLLDDNVDSPNNLSNRERFVTILDKFVDPISKEGEFARAFVLYKKIRLDTLFNENSSGNITDITSGSLYLFISQSGNIATANGGIDFHTRVRYTDV